MLPVERIAFMNATAVCDLYISVHDNDAGGTGSVGVVSNAPSAGRPMTRSALGKVFLEYLDPFDQGLHQSGIMRSPGAVAMLTGTDTRRANYAYLEIEFMDTLDPADATRYRYQDMVPKPFIERLANQIVAASVEALLARQNMATMTFNGAFRDTVAPPGPIW